MFNLSNSDRSKFPFFFIFSVFIANCSEFVEFDAEKTVPNEPLPI